MKRERKLRNTCFCPDGRRRCEVWVFRDGGSWRVEQLRWDYNPPAYFAWNRSIDITENLTFGRAMKLYREEAKMYKNCYQLSLED